MAEILSQKAAKKTVKKLKSQGKSVGIVIGFFDALSIRHIRLFKFAKKYVDFLVVGVENCETTKANRTNKDRPVETTEAQLEFLSEINPIDLVFEIEHIVDFDNPKAKLQYKKLFKEIGPTHLITNIITDTYAADKKDLADQLGLVFVSSVDTTHLQ